MSPSYPRYIGVFDSGLGGISVLKKLVEVMPNENFVFFGDSANAPYGEKPREWIRKRSREIAESLLDEGVKAIVIACNTATSVAARDLREAFPHVPIIGVEPALKPAALRFEHGRILVMATPITLELEKFHQLAEKWGTGCEVVPVPCPGLAARIEQGALDAPDVYELIKQLIGDYSGTVDAVVLGCTHYAFVAKQILEVIPNAQLFDGALGTAEQTKRRLAQAGLLSQAATAGSVVFLSSEKDEAEVLLYRHFLKDMH